MKSFFHDSFTSTKLICTCTEKNLKSSFSTFFNEDQAFFSLLNLTNYNQSLMPHKQPHQLFHEHFLNARRQTKKSEKCVILSAVALHVIHCHCRCPSMSDPEFKRRQEEYLVPGSWIDVTPCQGIYRKVKSNVPVSLICLWGFAGATIEELVFHHHQRSFDSGVAVSSAVSFTLQTLTVSES